jgi:hypothetical protein
MMVIFPSFAEGPLVDDSDEECLWTSEFNEYEDLTRGSKSLEEVNCLEIGDSLLETDLEDEVEHSESSSW